MDLMSRYNEFAAAVAAGNVFQLNGLVDKSIFRAVLPGGPEEGLDFSNFVPEMERRRGPFPDFGKYIVVNDYVIDSERHRVAVDYTMRLTHDRELVSWSGQSVSPSYKRVTLSAIDFVVFNPEGMVTKLTCRSDRLATLMQMGA